MHITGNGSSGTFQLQEFVGGAHSASVSGAATNNSWNHLAATATAAGGTGSLIIYYNGAQAGTGTGVGGGTTGTNVAVGNWYNTPSLNDAAYGYLADAAVWNCVLTPSEIQELWQGKAPGLIRPLNLRGWWRLDDSNTSIMIDRSFIKTPLKLIGSGIAFVPGPPRVGGDLPIIRPMPDPSFVMSPGSMPVIPPPPFILMPQIVT